MFSIDICTGIGHTSEECTSPIGARESTREACYKCGGKGHIKAKCPSILPEVCYRCGREGHFAADCKEAVSRDRDPRDDRMRGDYPPPGGLGTSGILLGVLGGGGGRGRGVGA